MHIPSVLQDDIEQPVLPPPPAEATNQLMTQTATDAVEAVVMQVKMAQKQLEQLRDFWRQRQEAANTTTTLIREQIQPLVSSWLDYSARPEWQSTMIARYTRIDQDIERYEEIKKQVVALGGSSSSQLVSGYVEQTLHILAPDRERKKEVGGRSSSKASQH